MGLGDWIRAEGRRLGCVEIRAADFYKTGLQRARELARSHPILAQGGRLSLGTPGPLGVDEVPWLSGIAEAAEALWISEPVGFRRTAELELPDVCPVRADPGNAAEIAERAREAADGCGRPLVLENVAAQLRIPGTLSEAAFLNLLCERADCGLLVDLAALFANASNQRFDALAWLRELEPRRVVGLRVGVCAPRAGRWYARQGGGVPEGEWQLAEEAMRRFRPRALLLAYETDVPHPSVLEAALERLAALAAEPAETRSA